MYTTENGVTSDASLADATLVKVTDYHPSSAGASQARLDSLLRRAERLIRGSAPPPSPVPTAYREAARDTELAVFEYLYERPSYADSESAGGVSVTYSGGRVGNSDGGTAAIIRDGMGAYVKGRGLRTHPIARG